MVRRAERLPAIMLRPDEILGDPSFRRLVPEARGLFLVLKLVSYSMPEPGVIPDESGLMPGYALCTAEKWAEHAEAVRSCFDTTTRPGFLLDADIRDAHHAQSVVRKTRRDAASHAANVRWGKEKDAVRTSGDMQKKEGTNEPTNEQTNEGSNGAPSDGSMPTPNDTADSVQPTQGGRRGWSPKPYYGHPENRPTPGWRPPGPLSWGYGGHLGVEVMGSERWRQLEPDELASWQQATAGVRNSSPGSSSGPGETSGRDA